MLGEHQVAVRAAHAERADAGDPRALPRAELRANAEIQLLQRNLGVRGAEVQARRQRAVAQREGDLQEAGDARRAFEVADVGLHRAHEQRVRRVARRAEHRAQRSRLDRVTGLGAGAVQLHVSDLGRIGPRALVGQPQDFLLPDPRRHGEPFAPAVVVDRAAAHHAVDVVAVCERGRERLEHDDAAALAARVAVRALVEGEAAPVRGEPAELHRPFGALRRDDQVHATGERDCRFPLAQALAGQVHGNERRGLSGIHRETGTGEPEKIRNAIRENAPVQPGDGVRGHRVRPGAADEGGVVVPDRADEGRGAGAAQRFRPQVRVLQRLPAQLQHEPLLRVHRGGFPR
ncbi:hypothetical protein GCM10022247_37840 [Allokutzneria multivorans]|uniref:Uncharacterized protein n=1 Tax=Allokutzneria multivorans TaxID=1142134 RepID=A0ABP7SHC7_9PSEU